MDSKATLLELRDIVARFVAEREWGPFHSPKNLSMSLAIEVAELMEHFQWISTDDSRAVADDPARMANISDEMADVFCYLLGLANALGIDLSTALREKMAANRKKYPIERYRGKWQ